MLQINNLHATVGDKPILVGLTLTLGLAGCSDPVSKGSDCASLALQRQRDVSQLMRDFKAANPHLGPADRNGYPPLKDSAKYSEFLAKLEGIENRYRTQCPEPR